MTPESARLNQVRAQLLDMEHRPDKALDEYKQAVEKEPNVAALHYALGGASGRVSVRPKRFLNISRLFACLPITIWLTTNWEWH